MLSALLRRFIPKMTGTIAVTAADGKRDSRNRLVWIDCEMTGLELDRCRLVEIACIVTDADLKVVDELGPVIISQPPEVLEEMSDWCKTTFKANGLLDRIKESEVSEREAEEKVLEFLKCHTKAGACPIAGNSVHMDRMFLAKYMPKIVDHLSYRIVDVSSLKELINRWYSKEQLEKIPPKQLKHLALDDIRESISELKYYREHFFRE